MASDLQKHWNELVKRKEEGLTFLREVLADLEHDRWSRWMNYLFTKGTLNPDGSFTINADSVLHWKRQAKTGYSDLSEKEKDSDRKEANNTLALIITACDGIKLTPILEPKPTKGSCEVCNAPIEFNEQLGIWMHLRSGVNHTASPKEEVPYDKTN